MNKCEMLSCIAITMILANAYILVLSSLQKRHNIKCAKRLIRMRHRLACKKAALEILTKIVRGMKDTP